MKMTLSPANAGALPRESLLEAIALTPNLTNSKSLTWERGAMLRTTERVVNKYTPDRQKTVRGILFIK